MTQAAADLDAVWSFWTPPYTAFYRWSWADDLTHLCSWIMSVRTAERHFPRRRLVTDDGGARMLVDQLGLPFTSVSTTLNALTEPDPRWWALGKLYAYREQQHPFVHLDSDVYLFGGLPDRLRKAAVFTQNPEPAPVSDATYYRPSAFLRTVREAGGWLPAAFSDYVDRGGDIALCTGIVGGRDLDLIGEYADQAIRLVEHSDNRPVWPDVEWLLSANVLVEQYLLGAVLDRAPTVRPYGRHRASFFLAAGSIRGDGSDRRRIHAPDRIGQVRPGGQPATGQRRPSTSPRGFCARGGDDLNPAARAAAGSAQGKCNREARR